MLGKIARKVFGSPNDRKIKATRPLVEKINALEPEFVVFSAGYANHFGHPAKEVVARVERVGAKHRLTALQGALHLRSDGRACHTESWRDIRRRFWSGY